MTRDEAIVQLVGQLAGFSADDPDLDEKVERLISLERKFNFSKLIPVLVRTKLYQQYPINEELLTRSAQLAAIGELNKSGLSTMHTGDFTLMEIESEHRAWGKVRVYAPYCRESQALFSVFLRSGSTADKNKMIKSCRSNR